MEDLCQPLGLIEEGRGAEAEGSPLKNHLQLFGSHPLKGEGGEVLEGEESGLLGLRGGAELAPQLFAEEKGFVGVEEGGSVPMEAFVQKGQEGDDLTLDSALLPKLFKNRLGGGVADIRPASRKRPAPIAPLPDEKDLLPLKRAPRTSSLGV